MLILSIESSCDETAAAVVDMSEKGRFIKSSVVASQISVHALYGGVVPEIAGRAHSEAISKVTRQALVEADMTLDSIDAVAVTNTPGLIGCLLVGVNFAKALAYSAGKPLIAVNHIKGHIAANYFTYPSLDPPFLAFVASGGHTSIIDARSHTDFLTVGRTRDDALGEAFDKTARVMGLPYPGGAEMDRLASCGNKNAIKFPSAAIADDTLDFSFSGIKTAVINYLHGLSQKNETYSREDVAASFTASVTDSVVKKLGAAAERLSRDKLVVAGGVASNSHLRSALSAFASERGIALYLPDRNLCTDNAAMIGAQAYYEYMTGGAASSSLNAYAS